VVWIRAEKRELSHERSMFEYLKGRLYNAIPDVYNEEAECHLLKAVSEKRITYLNLCLVYFLLLILSTRLN